jgi:hypothetical protein
MIDHGDLVERLERLGDALEFGDADLADEVVAEIRGRRRSVRSRRWLVAACVLLLVGAAAMGYPDSRRAVARWFGFDSLRVQVDPALSVPVPEEPFGVPGPGETLVLEVDGRPITVSAVDGRLNSALIVKTVGSSDQIAEVTVQGRAGLWISGEPHEVMYESSDGSVVVERVARDTLLWQDGDVLRRVEGFAELSDALAFAEGT